MRNHGFLWDGAGWRLSPVFDVNPTPGDGPKFLRNAIDFDDNSASVGLALRASEYYRVDASTARAVLVEMRAVVAHWRPVARSCSISGAAMERMASCLDGAATRQ